MKNRFFAIALSALLVLSLGACGGNTTSSTASSEAASSTVVSSEVESSEVESSEAESSEVESEADGATESGDVEAVVSGEIDGVELSEEDTKCMELLTSALTEMGETEGVELVSSTPADDKGVTTLRVKAGTRKLQATFYENEGELALFTVSKDKVRNHLFYCADTTLLDDLLGLKSGTLYTYADDAYAALLDCDTALEYAFTNEAAGQE